MPIKVASFNCNSIRKNIELVKNLLTDNDIVLLQEILITNTEINCINSLSSDFYCDYVASFDPYLHGLSGRPIGGLAIYWKKDLNNHVKSVIYSDNIMALKINMNNLCYLLVNVYMPYDDRSIDSLVQFRSICAQIEDIALSEPIQGLVLAGDFNADPNKGRFWEELSIFMNGLNLFLADSVLPMDSFTYLSPAHGSTSWLDHVIVSDSVMVSDVNIQYGLSIFDHFPVTFVMHVPVCVINDNCINDNCISDINVKDFILWDKMSPNDRIQFCEKVEFSLDELVNNDAFVCSEPNCCSILHINVLNNAYSYFIDHLKAASSNFTMRNKESKYVSVPGWNLKCKELYNKAREAFFVWNKSGRIRDGPDYLTMRSARSDFKNTLKKCKMDEDKIRKEKLASSFALKNKNTFWKDVKKLKLKAKPIVQNMDNLSHPNEIVNLFDSKFKLIFDDKTCQSINDDFEAKTRVLKNKLSKSKYLIHDFIVRDAIQSINDCIDIDGLHANHFKLGGRHMITFMSKMFSSFLNHGFIPRDMLRGEIRPIIKNSIGKISDSDNYRPITISTNCLKIFEYCISDHLCNSLPLSTRQFGFRKNTSTLMATTILKEIIMNYKDAGSSVYAAFIDLSKAFDKVNHSKLILKLIDSNTSPVIVNILKHIYENQLVSVSFNDCSSSSWLLGNGVRQGSVISPLLFNFYINEVLEKINNLNMGCKLGIRMHNAQGYADDLTLLSPSASGLQNLLNFLFDEVGRLDLSINIKKSVCMIFKPKVNRCPINPKFTLNNKQLSIVDDFKYLGIALTSNMRNDKDIRRCELAFLRQFYSIFRKFSYADESTLCFLFSSHCMSFYGSEIWCDRRGSKSSLRTLEVTYHKCIKKVMKVPIHTSNHLICEKTGFFVFKHLINWKMISFFFKLIRTESKCFLPHICHFLSYSELIRNVKEIFFDDYNIINVFENDIDAIRSRIEFVQSREERSIYTPSLL